MNLGRARRGEIVWAIALAAACLGSCALAASANAAFPGTNGKIAFVNTVPGDPSPYDAIFTVNPDGSGLSLPLTANDFGDSDPVWSADGQRIVFTRRVDQGQLTQVWVMNADGSGGTQLTTGEADCDPAFLPDGRVAFVRSPGFCPDEGDIWVRAVDGTEAQLTQHPPTVDPFPPTPDFNPTSSPDGQTIAFARGDYGDSGIYTVSSVPTVPLDVPVPRSGVDHGESSILDTSPNYSPDGGTIAFARCDGGEGCLGSPLNIVTIPANGGVAPDPVTNNIVAGTDPDDCTPAYSPDGTSLVFTHLTPVSPGSTNCNPDLAPAVLGFIAAPTGAQAPVLAVQPSGISGFLPDWQPVVAASAPSGGAGGALGALGSLNGRCFNEDVTIRGTDESDTIVGTPGNDVIRGFRGDDKINGKGGEDILCGGRGDDRIFGKKADDILIGGDDSDYLNGGPGLNRLFGGTPGAPEEKANNVCVVGKSDTEQNCQVVH